VPAGVVAPYPQDVFSEVAVLEMMGQMTPERGPEVISKKLPLKSFGVHDCEESVKVAAPVVTLMSVLGAVSVPEAAPVATEAATRVPTMLMLPPFNRNAGKVTSPV
jgi:hypothetical protein